MIPVCTFRWASNNEDAEKWKVTKLWFKLPGRWWFVFSLRIHSTELRHRTEAFDQMKVHRRFPVCDLRYKCTQVDPRGLQGWKTMRGEGDSTSERSKMTFDKW